MKALVYSHDSLNHVISANEDFFDLVSEFNRIVREYRITVNDGVFVSDMFNGSINSVLDLFTVVYQYESGKEAANGK